MALISRYPVPAAQYRVEEEIRRSRFITTVAPAARTDEAVAVIDRVSAEFGDATHNCGRTSSVRREARIGLA